MKEESGPGLILPELSGEPQSQGHRVSYRGAQLLETQEHRVTSQGADSCGLVRFHWPRLWRGIGAPPRIFLTQDSTVGFTLQLKILATLSGSG